MHPSFLVSCAGKEGDGRKEGRVGGRRNVEVENHLALTNARSSTTWELCKNVQIVNTTKQDLYYIIISSFALSVASFDLVVIIKNKKLYGFSFPSPFVFLCLCLLIKICSQYGTMILFYDLSRIIVGPVTYHELDIYSLIPLSWYTYTSYCHCLASP